MFVNSFALCGFYQTAMTFWLGERSDRKPIQILESETYLTNEPWKTPLLIFLGDWLYHKMGLENGVLFMALLCRKSYPTTAHQMVDLEYHLNMSQKISHLWSKSWHLHLPAKSRWFPHSEWSQTSCHQYGYSQQNSPCMEGVYVFLSYPQASHGWLNWHRLRMVYECPWLSFPKLNTPCPQLVQTGK